MKKQLTILIFVLLANAITSQVVKTINVSNAGTLSSLFTSGEKTTITNLVVTGVIDARDFLCMRDEFTLLAVLDLSGVNILAYNGSDTYTYSNPANQLPDMSFYRMNPDFRKITLHSITLPPSITAIGMLSFYGCSSLEKIVCMKNTPPTVYNMALYGISPTIYIPFGKTATYKAVVEWQSFNYIESSGATDNSENFSGNNKINLYPNPVKSDLKISLEGGSFFEIQNLSGQIVYSGDLNKNSIVQMSNFSSGIYLIKCKKGNTLEYTKMIKQ